MLSKASLTVTINYEYELNGCLYLEDGEIESKLTSQEILDKDIQYYNDYPRELMSDILLHAKNNISVIGSLK